MDSFGLIKKCNQCNQVCHAIRFQQNFKNWTSGNNDIDKIIQDSQLSVHSKYDLSNALEWISYDRFYDIKYITEDKFGKVYRANWIDGYIDRIYENLLHNENQDWERYGQNMFVNLKSLNNSKDITLEFMNKIKMDHKLYGITQDPETTMYMIVLNDICKKCNSICNAMHFQQNFDNWTSGNNDIDNFIQDTQLSEHAFYEVKNTLEWIPYDRLYNIKYITKDEFGKVYRANWIDGFISYWDSKNQNWEREGHNMFVKLKSLNTPKNFTLEFTQKIIKGHRFYGITQDPETKNYVVVLGDRCKKCYYACNTIHFQQNFENWTSGNNDIDKYIQKTQLSAHKNSEILNALEWIPYDKLVEIKYIVEGKFRANWIDGYINKWDDYNQIWNRKGHNMLVILKSLSSNLEDITSEFINEIKALHKVYGITQDPKIGNYMMVLCYICEKCNYTCVATRFQKNFENWTSGNHDIDKFIQDAQLSVHSDYEASRAIEWIPYHRFNDITYIAKGGFGKIYRASWIDGYIWYWDIKEQNWRRKDQYKFVALKSLNNSENVTLEFMNEITSHYKVNELLNSVIKFYGITQNPETKDYIMVMHFVENGNLRKFLNESYCKLNWYDKLNCLWIIAYGLNLIHRNELVHRDLHISNILYENCAHIYITDMGLCKPANYNASENAINILV
uniref:Protein kinase domain-containing protein n=1 Tax=Rhizophagus irregularis (strain DAOM 181602 / DAOM 197198 / MUCL 43194) TaxID=747089 RepID=U9TH97_RHIID